MTIFPLVILDCSHCLDLTFSKNTKKVMICGIISTPTEIQTQNPAFLNEPVH